MLQARCLQIYIVAFDSKPFRHRRYRSKQKPSKLESEKNPFVSGHRVIYYGQTIRRQSGDYVAQRHHRSLSVRLVCIHCRTYSNSGRGIPLAEPHLYSPDFFVYLENSETVLQAGSKAQIANVLNLLSSEENSQLRSLLCRRTNLSSNLLPKTYRRIDCCPSPRNREPTIETIERCPTEKIHIRLKDKRKAT